jgi:transposase
LPPRPIAAKGARSDEKRMRYSDTIRARMLRRMVGPAGVTAHALARETGISHSALSKWLRQAGKVRVMAENDDRPGGPPPRATAGPQQERSAVEKLRAVVETSHLEGQALGEYLRGNGLHQAEVEQWRTEALAALEGRKGGPPRPGPESRRVKELERELRHKEKALAETAALLVLRKKLNALWGDGGDDTDDRSEP